MVSDAHLSSDVPQLHTKARADDAHSSNAEDIRPVGLMPDSSPRCAAAETELAASNCTGQMLAAIELNVTELAAAAKCSHPVDQMRRS